ncbi:hypothetical protein XFF6990_380003 [Xanthomonas citri pv. fuscans]|uniref:Uncharacterized protein n=1 Tax=Xanthomonas campestris pv. phaseoli TaxID=317013 RepID=A0A7Z7J0P3_XANCH|nr:hypothetical protein XFF6990_380003 [Xanthomonas citri pv. fuscans]SOO23854.1 hypothetical protein XFF6991_310024 [Xanthomonas phaseoli pv. phaseoli]
MTHPRRVAATVDGVNGVNYRFEKRSEPMSERQVCVPEASSKGCPHLRCVLHSWARA